MRKREVKKYGGTFVIQLTPTDMKDFELEEGEQIDIEDFNSLKKRRSKKE